MSLLTSPSSSPSSPQTALLPPPRLYVQTVQRDWPEKAVFLVRDEYRELLKAALESPPANLLVTGQSRIGKSFACAFLILVLLAAGQPFFYIEHTSTIHHFSTHGVQCGNPNNVWDLDEGEAADQLLRASWLLIDVGPHGWEIPPAFLFAKFALCTSPEDGMRYYVKEFKALYWHMRPWSRTEALSVARHYGISDTKESLQQITPSLATFSPSVTPLERPSTFSQSWLQLPTPTSSNQ
uniref:Uncharacterized protein n=1 Tax=Mycena chlorophos TaxID=658473 RepID=A0ABQ0M1N9_MYCCL|nr:predicted protein [Mycena chlorophos]